MFNFTKIYDKINWRNKPDKTTPIDATNLGKIDTALDTIDNRVVELGNKANSVDSTLGDADISAIGDGTVKGGISALNSNLEKLNTKLSILEYYHYIGETDEAGNIYIPTSRTVLTVSTNTNGCKTSFFKNVFGLWYANIKDVADNPRTGRFELYMLII